MDSSLDGLRDVVFLAGVMEGTNDAVVVNASGGGAVILTVVGEKGVVGVQSTLVVAAVGIRALGERRVVLASDFTVNASILVVVEVLFNVFGDIIFETTIVVGLHNEEVVLANKRIAARLAVVFRDESESGLHDCLVVTIDSPSLFLSDANTLLMQVVIFVTTSKGSSTFGGGEGVVIGRSHIAVVVLARFLEVMDSSLDILRDVVFLAAVMEGADDAVVVDAHGGSAVRLTVVVKESLVGGNGVRVVLAVGRWALRVGRVVLAHDFAVNASILVVVEVLFNVFGDIIFETTVVVGLHNVEVVLADLGAAVTITIVLANHGVSSLHDCPVGAIDRPSLLLSNANAFLMLIVTITIDSRGKDQGQKYQRQFLHFFSFREKQKSTKEKGCPTPDPGLMTSSSACPRPC